ncbi:hypothetical protein AVEN_158255-1 [Araneus ventricosus]|uniref:Uncharacterized protein n=1 Tax=Araneus ventricosus TaxID=182803 RepID=A0A4Y2G479_ARAVE|nr:hypothetical protein AVEN_158255-1 [Araneus ventricosus]
MWATSREPVDGAVIASDVRASSCREQKTIWNAVGDVLTTLAFFAITAMGHPKAYLVNFQSTVPTYFVPLRIANSLPPRMERKGYLFWLRNDDFNE